MVRKIRKNYEGTNAFEKYIICDEAGKPLYGILNKTELDRDIKQMRRDGYEVVDERRRYPDISDLPGETRAQKMDKFLQKSANERRYPQKFGYIRVSTATQATKGNSLEDQAEQLEAEGVESSNIYKDVYTGTTTNRPQLNELMEILKKDDVLVVTKLDRIARSVQEGSALIQELVNRGVKVRILNMGNDYIDQSSTGQLLMNILLSFAQFERDLIVERTQEGRKSSGHLGGRPRIDKERIDHALELLKTEPMSQVVKETGISRATLYRSKSSYGMPD